MNLHGDQTGDVPQEAMDQAEAHSGMDNALAASPSQSPSGIFILGAADREQDLLPLFDAEKCRFYDPAADDFSGLLKSLLRHPSPRRLVVLTPRTPSSVRRKVAEAGLNRVCVEEGFLRGPGLPGRANPSFSHVIDDLGPHYDPAAPSRLETVLATYDFAGDPALMDQARALRDALIRTGACRFTHALRRHDPVALLGEKTRKRVVVLGHQPGTRAIEAANVLQISPAELVRLAQREHPGAEILFKPHPMDLHLGGTSSAEVRAALPGVVIPAGDLPLSQVLDTADHVITVASLGGFEAALRGLPVTVLGAPFYAGWGLTDDRAAPERRQRRLTAEEILAGAYILQSTYRDPLTHAPMAACDVVAALAAAQISEADPLSPDLTAPLVLAHLGGGPADELLRQMIPMAGLQPFDQKDSELRDKLLAHQQGQRALAPDRVAPVLLAHPVRLSLRRLLDEIGVPVIHLDEGFLFGGTEVLPAGQGYSYLVARRAPHYDASRTSDLELLLQSHDFNSDSALMARAAALKARILEAGLSAYNTWRHATDPAVLPAGRTAIRVLVLGQAAADPALTLANPRGCTLEQLLRIARREHPDAEILLCLPPKETAARAVATALARRLPGLHLLEPERTPVQLFSEVDHVFTISALAGFEAALRGLPVTVLGAPFYAGWGATDDRAAPQRRQRRLTIDQIFAAAYLLHPVYVDPLYRSPVSPEAVVDLLCCDLAAAASTAQAVEPSVALVMRPHESAALRHAFPGQTVTVHDYKDANFLKGVQIALRRTPSLIPVLHQRVFSSARRPVMALGRPWLEAADGFLCAVGSPERGAEPHSVLLDAQAPHYDAARVSQLETLLASHDFTADPALLPRARAAIARILAEGLTRYTPATPPADLAALYGAKTRKRVLVLGHREADAAVALANPLGFGNADLLRIAAREHPGAQILFKPHPSDMKPKLDPGSLPADVTVLAQPLALPQALETVDHVITLASLGGFEAALRGLPVTVLGAPFYAGWGLTDDRAAPERRQRRLTAEEIFAAAYMLYPAYVDPLYRRKVEIEAAIEALVQERARQMAPAKAKTDPKAHDFTLIPGEKGDGPKVRDLYLFGFMEYKASFIARLMPDANVWLPRIKMAKQMSMAVRDYVFPRAPGKGDVFLVWGRKDPAGIAEYAGAHGIGLHHMEDGFIRSIDLGGLGSIPLSYAYDTRGIYFDPNTPSDMEVILATYDFDADPELMARARTVMQIMKERAVSKYNIQGSTDLLAVISDPRRKILVIGQVEDDASILYGCAKTMTNNDLVRAAAIEHPDALIIYKPHPDVLMQMRQRLSDPAEVMGIAIVLTQPFRITDILDHVDEVYTITSLAGFEAALRGKKVTAFGCPFYAGWGITEDRQPNARRGRQLTVEQVFAVAYLLYPKYINPFNLQPITAEEALEMLAWMQKTGTSAPINGDDRRALSFVSKSQNARNRGDIGQAHALLAQASTFSGHPQIALERAGLWLSQNNIGAEPEAELRRAAGQELALHGDAQISARLALLAFLWEYRHPSPELARLALALSGMPKLADADRLQLAACLNWLGYTREAVALAGQNAETGHVALVATLETLSLAGRPGGAGLSAERIQQDLRRGAARLAERIQNSDGSFCLVGSAMPAADGLASRIDACKTVIRTVPARCMVAETGQKTSIVVRGPRNTGISDPRLDGCDTALVIGSNLLHRMGDGRIVFSRLLADYATLGVLPSGFYYDLCLRLGVPPSDDMLALYWMNRTLGPIPKDAVIGCSFLDPASAEAGFGASLLA